MSTSSVSHFGVNVVRGSDGRHSVEAPPRPALVAGAPPEFGGTAELWSPEHMLVGAVALCFVTTFEYFVKRTSAKVLAFHCHGDGKVEKTPTGLAFTLVRLHVHASVPSGDVVAVEEIITSARRHCLISHSLRCPVEIESDVRAVDIAAN